MGILYEKSEENLREPLDDLSSLLDIAVEIETNIKPINDAETTILSDNGEIISLQENADDIREK